MADGVEFTECEAEPATPTQPRLGIGHIMLWTGCVAISLGLQLWQRPGADGALWTGELGSGGVAVVLLGALIKGLWLAAPPLCVGRWYRGLSFPQQPGEWFLFINGLSAWTAAVADLLFVRMVAYDSFDTSVGMRWLAVHSLIDMFEYALFAAGCVAAAVWLRSDKAWAICLGAWAVVSLTAAAAMMFSSLTYFLDWGAIESIQWLIIVASVICIVAGIVSVGTFVAALIMDAKRKARRGWLHVVGIGSVVAVVALGTIVTFVAWVFPDAFY